MVSSAEWTGWLFDLYVDGDTLTLWLILDTGARRWVRASFTPEFYLGVEPARFPAWTLRLSHDPRVAGVAPVNRREFWTNRPRDVLAIRVRQLGRWWELVTELTRSVDPDLLFNVDLGLPHRWCAEAGVIPTGRVRAVVSGGKLQGISPIEPAEAIHYSLPPLRELWIEAADGARYHRPDAGVDLRVRWAAGEEILPAAPAERQVRRLHTLLCQHDPDLIWSAGGDAELFPGLVDEARRRRLPLALNRGGGWPILSRRGKSYVSYGRPLYKPPSAILKGRWHIDQWGSFFLEESGLTGTIEVARLGRLPVQTTARSSPGTAITAMEMGLAHWQGYLIPWKKQEPESFKTAEHLLTTDKGGLTYVPRLGFFESVGELDFVSMYAAIMARHNVSGETVNCACCHGPAVPRVPETGYRLCRRRRGIVPQTVQPLLTRRGAMKQAMAAAAEPERTRLEHLRTALKWCLVVAFGYQGYRNARFGQIEAHEAVTAFGREALLTAKTLAERAGFRRLSALTDSLWLTKPGATLVDYERLAAVIEARTGLAMSVEALYDWCLFLPGKGRPTLAVPNRYVACKGPGQLKVRGLEVRRHDTAPFIQNVQREILLTLSRGRSRQEVEALLPDALALLRRGVEALLAGEVPWSELVMTRTLSKVPEDYERADVGALGGQALLAQGIRLHPGQEMAYVITAHRAKDPRARIQALPTTQPLQMYDQEKYADLLIEAAGNLLGGLGWPADRLREALADLLPPRRTSSRPGARPTGEKSLWDGVWPG